MLDIVVLIGGIYSCIKQGGIKRLEMEKMRLEIDSLNLDIVKKYNIDMRKAIRHTGKVDGKYYCPYCGRVVVFVQEEGAK